MGDKSVMGKEITTIEIQGNKDYPQCANIYINGQEIHGVTAIRYEHEAGCLPELTVDIGGMEMDLNLMQIKADELVRLRLER